MISDDSKDKSTLSEDKLEGLEQIVGEEADAKAILKAARASMGMDTSEQDMENIHIFTERMVSLAKYRKEVSPCLSHPPPSSPLSSLAARSFVLTKCHLLSNKVSSTFCSVFVV